MGNVPNTQSTVEPIREDIVVVIDRIITNIDRMSDEELVSILSEYYADELAELRTLRLDEPERLHDAI